MRKSGKMLRLPVRVVGILSIVVAGTALHTDPSSGSTRYSPSIYPRPVAALTSSTLHECPNPSGLRAFNSTAISQAVREISRVSQGRFPASKLETDPSFWSSLAAFNERTSKETYQRQEFIKGVPSAPGATLMRSSCGKSLVTETEVIEAVPLKAAGVRTNCNDCTVHYYFVNRRGYVLLYWVF